jgi:hypothetical protein
MIDDEKKVAHLRSQYRNTFTSKAGRVVLSHMLAELRFYSTAMTEEEVTLQNYAKNLLAHMGILDADNVQRITDALLTVPPKGTTTNEQGEE